MNANLREPGPHVVLKSVKRGDQPRSVLLHELCALFIHHRAMLDGVHAGAHCGFNAFSAFRVRHDFFSGTMCDLHGTRHLFLA